jgi:hypothetical protein
MTTEQINRNAAEYNRCRKLGKRMQAIETTEYRRAVARKQQIGFCARTMNRIKRQFAEAGYDVSFDAIGNIVRVEY